MSDDVERLCVELRSAAKDLQADFPGVANTVCEAANALAALVRERDEARTCAAESAAILRRVQDSRDAAIRALPIAPAPDREAVVETICTILWDEGMAHNHSGRAARAVLAALEAAGALK